VGFELLKQLADFEKPSLLGVLTELSSTKIVHFASVIPKIIFEEILKYALRIYSKLKFYGI
jgi:hypothetical protein